MLPPRARCFSFTVLVIVGFLSASISWASAPKCSQFDVNETQTSTTEYNQKHFRKLDELLRNLPETFAEVIAIPGIKTLDSGGGYGLASLSLSRQAHNRSTVINSQNYWQHLMLSHHKDDYLKFFRKL